MSAAPAVNVNVSTKSDYPYAQSAATKMLSEALDRAEKEKGWSQRYIAKVLDYKTSVVLSHMALGRVPIPVDRALDFCRLLKIPSGEFLLAVLEQRHPEIDWTRHLPNVGSRRSSAKGSDSYLVKELESLAGRELDELDKGTVNVLREAVAGRDAQRRWLSTGEVPVVEDLRRTHPDGLSPAQRKELSAFLEKL